MAINAYNGDGGKGLDRLLGIVSTLSNMGILPGETKNRAPLIEEQTRGHKLNNDYQSQDQDPNSDSSKLVQAEAEAVANKMADLDPKNAEKILATIPLAKLVSAKALQQNRDKNQLFADSEQIRNDKANALQSFIGRKNQQDQIKRLPADKVLSVNEGKNAINMLGDLNGTIEQNFKTFGPIAGNIASLNPYDETGATINSQMKIASQSIGKFLEGGVLRKEDEDKYRKMLPQLSDTPEVSKNKLQLVDRMLKNKLAADIKALNDSGYDASGLMGGVGAAPGLPNVIRKQKIAENGNSVIPNANADSHPMDIQAVDWAKKNPKDPRSVKILKANGVIK